MRQALLAALTAGGLALAVFGPVAAIIHHLRHGRGYRYLWGVLVLAALAALYQFLNYIGR